MMKLKFTHFFILFNNLACSGGWSYNGNRARKIPAFVYFVYPTLGGEPLSSNYTNRNKSRENRDGGGGGDNTVSSRGCAARKWGAGEWLRKCDIHVSPE